MEDVPLGEEELVASPSTTDGSKPNSKPNTLKRLFKLGRKSGGSKSECAIKLESDAEAAGAVGGIGSGVEEKMDSPKVKPTSSIGRRFHLLLRNSRKSTADLTKAAQDKAEATTESLEMPESSNSPPPSPAVQEDLPIPNAKPVPKSSFSSYWHNIFKRHQNAQHEQKNSVADVVTMAVNAAVDKSDESLNVEGACGLTVVDDAVERSGGGGGIPVNDIIDEVQTLEISDDFEDDQQQQEEQQKPNKMIPLDETQQQQLEEVLNQLDETLDN